MTFLHFNFITYSFGKSRDYNLAKPMKTLQSRPSLALLAPYSPCDSVTPFTSCKTLRSLQTQQNPVQFQSSRDSCLNGSLIADQSSLKSLQEQLIGARNRQKRNTLNVKFHGKDSQENNIRNVVSPIHTTVANQNPKINFTYRGKNTNSLITLVQVNHRKVQLIKKEDAKIKIKKNRNRLCTAQFSYSYFPQFYSSNPNCKASILKAKAQFEKEICDQKVASTAATQSFYKDNGNCEQSIFQSSTIRQNISQHFSTNSKKNLIEGSFWKLGQTVMLQNYSFGGIIKPSLEIETQAVRNEKLSSRKIIPQGWNNYVKGLIQYDDDDLKHSIHCGPETRLDKPIFEMLQGFGREIKESCFTIQE